MLILTKSLKEIDLGQLMLVYEESNREKGCVLYPRYSVDEQRLMVEQDLIDYLYSVLKDKQAMLAIWAPHGKYKAALRLEQYADGLLLTALETIADERRIGHAEALLRNVIPMLDASVLYSHIHKDNVASVRLHEKCGFLHFKDHAVYLDCSVSARAYTFVMYLK